MTTLDLAAVSAVLPHRFPMLLVDRVLELEPGRLVRSVKTISGNEPWYRDVTAGTDVSYPPVLLVESWCQTAGVLAAWDSPNPDVLAGNVMLFGGMSGVEFGDPVRPGDTVEHEARLVRALSDTVIFEGRSTVDGRTVLTVERIVMAMRPAEALQPA